MRLLGTGILYIHGRAMDLAPILILDLIKLGDLLDANQITPEMFTNLMNFYCSYMQQNMLVPGHVEKWVSLTNVN